MKPKSIGPPPPQHSMTTMSKSKPKENLTWHGCIACQKAFPSAKGLGDHRIKVHPEKFCQEIVVDTVKPIIKLKPCATPRSRKEVQKHPAIQASQSSCSSKTMKSSISKSSVSVESHKSEEPNKSKQNDIQSSLKKKLVIPLIPVRVIPVSLKQSTHKDAERPEPLPMAKRTPASHLKASEKDTSADAITNKVKIKVEGFTLPIVDRAPVLGDAADVSVMQHEPLVLEIGSLLYDDENFEAFDSSGDSSSWDQKNLQTGAALLGNIEELSNGIGQVLDALSKTADALDEAENPKVAVDENGEAESEANHNNRSSHSGKKSTRETREYNNNTRLLCENLSSAGAGSHTLRSKSRIVGDGRVVRSQQQSSKSKSSSGKSQRRERGRPPKIQAKETPFQLHSLHPDQQRQQQ